jgi:hypothetical protein
MPADVSTCNLSAKLARIGGDLSSDGGLLLLRQAVLAKGLVALWLAAPSGTELRCGSALPRLTHSHRLAHHLTEGQQHRQRNEAAHHTPPAEDRGPANRPRNPLAERGGQAEAATVAHGARLTTATRCLDLRRFGWQWPLERANRVPVRT